MAQHQQAVANGTNIQLVAKSLYVGALEANVTDVQIYNFFRQIGPVLSVSLCKDANTSLGYAYVTYSTAENASEALHRLNDTLLNGERIWIIYSPLDPNIEHLGSANIFVRNLAKSVSDTTFYYTFRACGRVLCSKISRDASGKSRGYGFVYFDQEEAANNAINGYNRVFIGTKRAYVSRL